MYTTTLSRHPPASQRILWPSRRNFPAISGRNYADRYCADTDGRRRLSRAPFPRRLPHAPRRAGHPPRPPPRARPRRLPRAPPRTPPREAAPRGHLAPGAGLLRPCIRNTTPTRYPHIPTTPFPRTTPCHAAPFTIVLRAKRVISLGVRRKVYSRHCLRFPLVPGIPVSAGIRGGTRTGWRRGMATGLGSLAAGFPGRDPASGGGRDRVGARQPRSGLPGLGGGSGSGDGSRASGAASSPRARLHHQPGLADGAGSTGLSGRGAVLMTAKHPARAGQYIGDGDAPGLAPYPDAPRPGDAQAPRRDRPSSRGISGTDVDPMRSTGLATHGPGSAFTGPRLRLMRVTACGTRMLSRLQRRDSCAA
jgi:hypothetical protein